MGAVLASCPIGVDLYGDSPVKRYRDKAGKFISRAEYLRRQRISLGLRARRLVQAREQDKKLRRKIQRVRRDYERREQDFELAGTEFELTVRVAYK